MIEIDKLKKFFKLNEFTFNKNKKMFLIAITVILVLIIISYLIYIFFFEETLGSTKGTFFLEKIDSNYAMTLTNEDIIKPPTLDNLTYSFWLHINNYYKNSQYWRHIFHKGTPISENKVLDFTFWENIETSIDLQCPGVWLHPNKNILRFSFTTTIDKIYPIKEHAFKTTKVPIIEVRERNAIKKSIEYFDIYNIPVNEFINISLVLNKRLVEVYVNGLLRKIHTLQGDPEINDGDLYLHYPKTYDGYVSNFTYIPKKIKKTKVNQLYLDKPKRE